jgi:integrase
MLSDAAAAIGSTRPAAEVVPGDVIAHVSAIHGRGAKIQAATLRAYMSAAFTYGLKAENDYTRKDAGARWGLTSKPIAAVPAAEGLVNARNRFLTPAEFRAFWRWLEGYDVNSGLAPAMRLMLATGQRSEEILRITAATYEARRALIYWPNDKKTGSRTQYLSRTRPSPSWTASIRTHMGCSFHALRIQRAGRSILACDGWSIGSSRRTRKSPYSSRATCDGRSRRSLATPGVSKELRDRLQNHSKASDTSAKHYDRYDYLSERRAAMAKWETYFLSLVLAGQIKEIGQREVPMGMAAALL